MRARQWKVEPLPLLPNTSSASVKCYFFSLSEPLPHLASLKIFLPPLYTSVLAALGLPSAPYFQGFEVVPASKFEEQAKKEAEKVNLPPSPPSPPKLPN